MNFTKTNLHFCRSIFSIIFLLFSPAFGLNLDGTLLLSFKYSIFSDPVSVLDNWDYNDATPCSWRGVTCTDVENSIVFPDLFRVISLTLPNSQLLGIIPEELGLIPHLKTLDLSNNFLNGTLPLSLFNNTASELQTLSLSNNVISGVIPDFKLKSLKLLNLSDNALVGNFPMSIASLRNLTAVSVRSNYLSGPIPSGIRSIEVLDLSSNLFNGSLPVEFGGGNLKYLNLSSNKLSGEVPPEFAVKIPGTAAVDLSFNDLCGKAVKKLCTIPATLSNPPLNVSSSSTTPAIAAIPKTIGSNAPMPENSTATETPNAAATPPRQGLKPGAIAGIAVVPLAGVGVLAAVFLYVYQRKKKKGNSETKDLDTISTVKAYEYKRDPEASMVIKESRNVQHPAWPCLSITNGDETTSEDAAGSDNDDENSNNDCVVTNNHSQFGKNNYLKERGLESNSLLVMVDDGETQLEIETLFKASAYVLGSSGGSIVYKAVLQDGISFAVRRIGDEGGGGAVDGRKEFENRVRAIAKLRHHNLVRVRGFYWGDDEKLVIYDYVSNGSLANVGCRKIGSSPYHLPFEARLKIAKGVARGLTYIHNKKNVHGNIKPSNILLTPDMEPIISDFGLHRLTQGRLSRKSDGSARHFRSKRASSHDEPVNGSPYIVPAGFVGCTSPYHAPESHRNLKPNPKWDVYSFGILLLELLTGKVFSDRELSQWTGGSVVEEPCRVLRMADVAIRGDVAGREEATMAWFKLGFSCASLVPQKRPCMRDALHLLEKIPCSN